MATLQALRLTGLLNCHALAQRRDAIWSGDVPRPVAAIMLDIDRFKLFNDIHGHLEGDRCIRQVGDCVLREMAGRGHVFRFGGEEILVLLPDMQPGPARDLAEDIRAAIEAERIAHRGLGDGHVVTGSLGLASGMTENITLEALMNAADTALYQAKHAGRNRVAVAGMEERHLAANGRMRPLDG